MTGLCCVKRTHECASIMYTELPPLSALDVVTLAPRATESRHSPIGVLRSLDHFVEGRIPAPDMTSKRVLDLWKVPIQTALQNLIADAQRCSNNSPPIDQRRTNMRKRLQKSMLKAAENRASVYDQEMETSKAEVDRLWLSMGGATGRRGAAWQPPEAIENPQQAIQTAFNEARLSFLSFKKTSDLLKSLQSQIGASEADTELSRRFGLLASSLIELQARPGQWHMKSLVVTRVNAFIGGSVPLPGDTLNLLLLGPSGVGKSTTARIVGNIFSAIGLVSNPNVTVRAADTLKGRFEGETPGRVHSFLEQNLDACVVLDEAYSLATGSGDGRSGGFGAEAVNALVMSMDRFAGLQIIMFIGYAENMQTLLEMNSGFERRFREKVIFRPYTDVEMLDIWELMCKTRGLPALDDKAQALFKYVIENAGPETPCEDLFARHADSLRSIAVIASDYIAERGFLRGAKLGQVNVLDMVTILVDRAAQIPDLFEQAVSIFVPGAVDLKLPLHKLLHDALAHANGTPLSFFAGILKRQRTTP